MNVRGFAIAIGVMAGLGLAACDGGNEPVSALQVVEVRDAMNGEPAAFETYFEGIKGQTVKWSGRVVESVRQFGDDYIEEGLLLVDLDADGQVTKAADAVFMIKPSQIDSFKPDQPVTFVAVIREFEKGQDGPVLKLELKEIE